MKRSLLISGVLLLLGGLAPAQEDSLEKLQQEVNDVFQKGGKAGPDKAELAKVIDRTATFAVAHKTEESGFQASMFVLQLEEYLPADKQLPVFTGVMDALLENWINDDKIADVLQMLGYMPKATEKKAKEYTDWILKQTTSESAKCAGEVMKLAKEAGELIDPAKCKAMIAKLEAVQKKYGEKAKPFGIDEMIEGLKAIGAPAQEVSGKDLDGVDFKLSDYKGKVVLLDFWGYW